MKKQFKSIAITILVISVINFSCKKDKTPENLQHEINSTAKSANNNSHGKSKRIYVTNTGELYAAMNNPENTGNTLVLAAGTYSLSPAYPNGGRLELLRDMKLLGQPGRPEDVVIDVSGLPNPSYVLGPGRRTGAIRMGNGINEIEWMTVQNTAGITNSIRSLIQTDIALTPVAQVKVAHCILKGSSIGLNIINRDPVNNGRIVEAEIENNEILNNDVLQFGSGIQLQNSSGIADAVIRATFRGNYIHGNRAGVLAFNASSQQCLMEIKSYEDRVENNGMGFMFNGGFCESAANPDVNNTLTFEAFATKIKNNTGNPAPPFLFPACGVYAAGAEAFPPFGPAGTGHHNKLDIKFNGCRIEDNAGSYQIIGFGGHSFHPSSTPVGTFNATRIYLQGLSNNATVSATPSFPAEPAGTNTIDVYR
jgi:hypothetical protein